MAGISNCLSSAVAARGSRAARRDPPGEDDDNDDHDGDDEESDDGDDVMVLKVKCIHSHGSSSSAGFTFSEVHLTYNTA